MRMAVWSNMLTRQRPHIFNIWLENTLPRVIDLIIVSVCVCLLGVGVDGFVSCQIRVFVSRLVVYIIYCEFIWLCVFVSENERSVRFVRVRMDGMAAGLVWVGWLDGWLLDWPVWIRLCMFSVERCEKRLAQISHAYGRSPVCVRWCMSRYGFLQNAAGHWSHWKGRLPTVRSCVWLCECVRSLFPVLYLRVRVCGVTRNGSREQLRVGRRFGIRTERTRTLGW